MWRSCVVMMIKPTTLHHITQPQQAQGLSNAPRSVNLQEQAILSQHSHWRPPFPKECCLLFAAAVRSASCDYLRNTVRWLVSSLNDWPFWNKLFWKRGLKDVQLSSISAARQVCSKRQQSRRSRRSCLVSSCACGLHTRTAFVTSKNVYMVNILAEMLKKRCGCHFR
jgi:hypothetical protein